VLTVPTKICKICMTEFALSEFHDDGRARDGKSSKCRECHTRVRRVQTQNAQRTDYRKNHEQRRAYVRNWHQNNKDKVSANQRREYETIKGRARYLYQSAKTRLSEGFTLSLDHVEHELRRGRCAATNIPFVLSVNRDGKQQRSFSPYAPSVDKIDPRKPYTDENTRIVIWQYNVMKGELSDEQLLVICRHIVGRAS
jgi:hypothetical protein